MFKNIGSHSLPAHISTNDSNSSKKVVKKQTTITDTFKERKRKSNDDINQLKEKKKRNTAVMEKFQNLKNSFSVTSNQVNDKWHKTTEMSNKTLDTFMETNQNISYLCNPEHTLNNITQDTVTESIILEDDMDMIEITDDNLCDINNIESIMEEIENEISKSSNRNDENKTDENLLINTTCNNKDLKYNTDLYRKASPKAYFRKNTKKLNKKTNYNFIELLEKNRDLDSDTDNSPTIKNNSTGFSDAIRNKIENYLKNTYTNANPTNKVIEELINEEKTYLPDVCLEPSIKGKVTYNNTNDNIVSPVEKDIDTHTNSTNKVVQERIHEEKTELPGFRLETSAKGSQGDCHFADNNNTNEIIVAPELQKSDEMENYNIDDSYLSEKMVTGSFMNAIIPYNRLDIITEENVEILQKEDEVNEIINNATNTDILLAGLIKSLSSTEVSAEFESCKEYDSIIQETKSIEQRHNNINKNILTLYNSNNINIQDKELLSADSIWNQLINNEIADIVNANPNSKEIVVPSKERNIPYPYSSNDSLSSTFFYPMKSNNDNHIIKYTYSRTNINYTTKNMPDHIIRVKRKLQVDVLTEIVPKREKSSEGKNVKINKKSEEHNIVTNLQNDDHITYIDKSPSISSEGKICSVENLHEDIDNKLGEMQAAEEGKTNIENITNNDNKSSLSSVAQILQKHFNVFR